MKKLLNLSIVLLLVVAGSMPAMAQQDKGVINFTVSVKNNNNSNFVASVPVEVINDNGSKIAEAKTDLLGSATMKLDQSAAGSIMVQINVVGFEPYAKSVKINPMGKNELVAYLKPQNNKTIDQTVKKGITNDSKEVIMEK